MAFDQLQDHSGNLDLLRPNIFGGKERGNAVEVRLGVDMQYTRLSAKYTVKIGLWAVGPLRPKHVHFASLFFVIFKRLDLVKDRVLRYVLTNIEHRHVRSSNVCVKRFTDMSYYVIPWSTCSRLVSKTIEEKKTTEAIHHVFAFSRACGQCGHVLATSANPRS